MPAVFPSARQSSVRSSHLTVYRMVHPETPECLYNMPHVHRSEEHTSELQSRLHLVCRLLLEKKKPRRSASDRQQRALRQAFAFDSSAARPQRAAEWYLAAARDPARTVPPVDAGGRAQERERD